MGWDLRARSVLRYLRKTRLSSSNSRQICVALAKEVPVGTLGTWPGLTASMNSVLESVLYTAGVTVRYKRPRLPPPRSY